MTTSNYPKGFSGGVTIRGVPILNSHPGNVYWVGPSGLANGDGSFTRPYSALSTALAKCSANKGDIVMVQPGYTETVSTAGGLAVSTAGVSIIGLGSGADRPTLTFSATDATMTISAASITVQNIITKPSIDSVVSPIVVSASDCWLDIEHQDASATVEAVRAILTTAAADRLHVDLKYRGYTGGNAVVNAVRMVGVDTADIKVDFYGVASTAVVELHTTACTNVKVSGRIYNSGTTDGSKTVVDTVTGSTWSAEVFDATAGAAYTGGSGASLAKDDVSAISDALYGANGIVTFPAAAVAGNSVSLAEVIRYVQESGVGAQGDAAVQAGGTASAQAYLKGILDVLSGTTGISTFPAAAAAANNVSMAEVLRYVSENQNGRLVSKAYANLTGYDTAAAFTVTGDVMVKVVGVVGSTAITSTSGTTTLAVGTTELSTGIIAASTIDNTQFAATDVWVDSSPANDVEVMASAAWNIVGGGADIALTRSVDDITAGSLTLYCWWMPLSSDGAVVAA